MAGALLDTMAVLRMTFRPELLSAGARERILDTTEPLFYSTVSLWEISIKMSKGGYEDLVLPDDWDERIVDGFGEQGIGRVEIAQVHCKRMVTLPFHHKDPFDRMLIAQALDAGFDVISSDKRFDDYGVMRLW